MENEGIKIWTKEEFVKICPLCKKGVITGSSIKQLKSRMNIHQTSKKCIKKREENESTSK